MNVAIYARVSTPRQQQAQTIDQQLERLHAHVVAQGDWHLAEEHIYRDDGYSGAQLNRPGLDRLRDHAVFAAFELVLITAPDRLARSYVHQGVRDLVMEVCCGLHNFRVRTTPWPSSVD